jgi:cytochrome P450
MAEEAGLLADRWDANGNAVDGNAEMVRLTLRVVGRAIFGDDVGQAGEVLDWAFPVLNRRMFRRATSPVVTPESWPTPDNRRAARARRALDQVIDELVARRRASGANGEDLLSRLLSARDSETGQAMDPQEVRDQALIFLLAGHETTSTALTFTYHLLGRHPDEQEKMRAEVDDVLDGRAPAVADVPALERTAMAIKEAMRLYPPAYALGRLLNEDDEIGGYRIPAGSNVLVSQWATHRHPEFWPQPERFDPSRFSAEREAERHPYAYFPFGRGPRSCIGSHFAMLESVIAVAAVLQLSDRQRERAGGARLAWDHPSAGRRGPAPGRAALIAQRRIRAQPAEPAACGSARQQGNHRRLHRRRRERHHHVLAVALEKARRPAGSAQALRDAPAHEQALARRRGTLLQERLEVTGGKDVTAEVHLAVADAFEAVLGLRLDDHLSCGGADHALVVAELEAHFTLHHRPALLLARMKVRGQPASGLEPGVNEQILAVGSNV